MRLAIIEDDPTTFAPGDEIPEDALPLPDEPDEAVDGDVEVVDEVVEEEVVAATGQKWLLVVEGVETGDGRSIAEGGLTWRDLPLPLMATDVTDEGHDGAKLVAMITSIERVGSRIEGMTTNIESDDPDVLRLQKLMADGHLRGVSVDLDNVEGSMVVEEMPEPVEGEDGEVEVAMSMPKVKISAARIMGATAVPFPAFAEAGQIAASLVAGAMQLDTEQPVESPFPVHPPTAWFSNPMLSGPTPLDVTDDGRVFGHVALWNSCHRGFGTCTPPPRAPNKNYEHFHTGTLVTDDGTRVGVGNITVDSGHADITDSASMAKQHYDHTGWIGADIVCGEDAFGIWMAGSVRPEITPAALRALRATDVSGDWRAIDGRLRLIGLASVPVPGFVKTQVASGELQAMVAAVPVCVDDVAPIDSRVADRIALSVGRTREQIMAERDRIAFGIGRHPAQQRAALRDRVNG